MSKQQTQNACLSSHNREDDYDNNCDYCSTPSTNKINTKKRIKTK